MHIQIHTQGFGLTHAIDEHTRRQLQFHLSHFEHRIRTASVFLRDINGPKGGPDKKVLIRLELTSKNPVTVERTRSNLYTAINTATHQAKRAVKRAINKQQRMEKLTLRQLGRVGEA